jgi:hypothetical protein
MISSHVVTPNNGISFEKIHGSASGLHDAPTVTATRLIKVNILEHAVVSNGFFQAD